MARFDSSTAPLASPVGLPRREVIDHHLADRLAPPARWSRIADHGLLWLLSAGWFGLTAWLRPLAIPDEGRYVGVAREMLESGRWLVPTLDGLPFLHKPPLFYWITAGSMKLFGINVMAARGASIVAAASILVGLHAFMRRWLGAAIARRTTLVLATLPLFYGGAQFGNPDMLVATCIGGAILLVAHAVLQDEAGEKCHRALAAAFGIAALGVLAKGMIGLVLPAAVVLLWATFSQRLRRLRALIAWAPGWAVFVAIAAPWFIQVQARHGDFFHYFFVVQHVERFTAQTFNNAQPWYFYPGVLLVTALPWSPWLLRRLQKTGWRRPDPGGLRALMACWLVVVVGFFSLPHSKLVGYVLPALPPLAFFAADAAWAIGTRTRLVVVTASLAATLCVGLAIGAHFFQHKSMAGWARALAASRMPKEPVYFVGNYYFDVAFYANLADPVQVVDAWAPADLAQDTWRRALVDAAAFAGPSTHSPLMLPEVLAAALCRDSGSWLIGAYPSADPTLSRIAPASASEGVGLWHVTPGTFRSDALAPCP